MKYPGVKSQKDNLREFCFDLKNGDVEAPVHTGTRLLSQIKSRPSSCLERGKDLELSN